MSRKVNFNPYDRSYFFKLKTEVNLSKAAYEKFDGSDAAGNGDIINLTHEQVRTLVFIYRGGRFDRKLQAVGKETAV